MREMDFTEKNLFNRLCGVNTIWSQIQGEVIKKVKWSVERAMGEEVTAHLGRGRYERVGRPTGYRNGSYARWLLTRYGWIEDLLVPRVREGGFESMVFRKYRRRCRVIDEVVLEAAVRERCQSKIVGSPFRFQERAFIFSVYTGRTRAGESRFWVYNHIDYSRISLTFRQMI